MDTPRTSVRSFRGGRRACSAFSLIEVAIAVGIAGFAFISVFGLVPTGLNTFHQALDCTVRSTIIQRVLADAQQADFDELIQDSTGTLISGIGATGNKAIRYFDDQGNEVVPATPGSPNVQEKQKIAYWVNTRIMPVTGMPVPTVPPPPEASNPKLATVTIQVANNPANRAIASGTNHFWNDRTVPIFVYCRLVARSK